MTLCRKPSLVNYSWVIGLAFAVCALPSLVSAGGLYLAEMASPDSLGTVGVGNVTNDRNASAGVTNPAGLSAIEDNEWLVGLQVMYLDAEIDIDQPVSDKKQGGGFSGLPAIFYAHRVHDNVVLGGALHAVGGASLDFGDSWGGRYFLNDVGFSFLHLTASASYQVNDELSLGLGLIGAYATLDGDTSVNTLLPGDGKIKLEDFDDIAPGFSLGLMYQIADAVQLGLHYTSKIEYELEGKFKTSGVGGGDLDLPWPPIIIPGGSKDLDLDLDAPATYTAGLNFEATDDLELMVHVSYQKWEDFGEMKIKFDNGTAVRADMHLNNTYDYGIAASYQFPGWKGYTGVNYATSIVDRSDRVIALPGDGTYKFGLGGEIPLANGKVLGLGYTFAYMGKAGLNQSNALATSTLDGEFDNNYLHILGMSLQF